MPRIKGMLRLMRVNACSGVIQIVFGDALYVHAARQASQAQQTEGSQRTDPFSMRNALVGQTVTQSPQWMHAFIVSGLWQ